MAKEIRVEKYTEDVNEKWDKFIQRESVNGTFLQSRNFLNYHPDGRFVDASVVIYRGNSEILAVVPAAEVFENGKRVFSSHPGSTFGGIVFNRQFYDLEHVELAIEKLEAYCKECGYQKMILKPSGQIFADEGNDLLEYFLFQKGYHHNSEISFVIDFHHYKEDILSNFTSARRRDYRYAEKNNLEFRELQNLDEIEEFYNLLCENLRKFDTKPVHTLEELIDFKTSRLEKIVRFFGSYYEQRMVAGSMAFMFGKKIFHTQYLAASQEDLKLYPNNFNDTKMIMLAQKEGFNYFSFGISTEEHGHVLNMKLAQFKEGFGTQYFNNKIWHKDIDSVNGMTKDI